MLTLRKGRKFKYGLRFKSIVSISLLIIIISAVLGWWFRRVTIRSLTEKHHEYGLALATNLAYNSSYSVAVGNLDALQELIEDVIDKPHIAYVTVFDHDGQILRHITNETGDNAASDEVLQKALSASEPIVHHQKGEKVCNILAPIETDIFGEAPLLNHNHEMPMSSMTETNANDFPIGTVLLGVSLRGIYAKINRIRNRTMAFIFALIVMGIAASAWFMKKIVAPVKETAQMASIIAAGDFSQFIPVKAKSSDEIKELATAFNQMAVDLQSSREKLEEYNRTLEQRVKERTQELEDAYIQLRQSEYEVRQSFERLDMIVTSIQGYLYLTDTQNNEIQWANSYLLEQNGDVIGKRCHEVFFKREFPCDNCARLEVLSTGQPVQEMVERESPDDTSYFLYTWSPIKDEHGNITQILHLVLDITKQKRLEEKYRDLIENANEAIFVIQDRKLVFLNPMTTQITGYSRAELLAKPFVEFIHPDDRKMVLDRHLRRLKGEDLPGVCSFRIISQDDSIRWVELNTVVINWEGKAATLNFLTDITERKQMEQELHKLDKLKSVGVLAGGIAHDFNNLLTAILGNIQLAKMSSTSSDVTEKLEAVEKASMQTKNLTQRLLTFSEGGAPVKETASISELLKETAEFVLSGSNVRCEFSIPDDLWPAEIDTGQISEVIQNLVVNADQAMPNGGVIRIKAENVIISDSDSLPLKEGKQIMVSVSDEGVGISEENLSKIFDPYFSTKDRGSDRGTGLGLAVCHSIIEKHGGHITVESELNVGTTFYFYLPAFTKQETEESSVKEEPKVGEGKILVMDDQEIVREVADKILVQLGYDVELTSCGEEAIELYKEYYESGQPFDAVILDITVRGGMGGKETLEKLIKIDPKVKAIVSSGYSTDPIMSNYEQYGFIEAIAKPYKIKELSDVLRNVTVVSIGPF